MSTVLETRPLEESLKDRYEAVRQRVAAAAEASGRRAADIVVVAVTKHAAIDQIRELIGLGHMDLGENRVQVLTQHAAQVDEYVNRLKEMPSARAGSALPNVRWHMIGHLQRNKVRKVLPLVRLVHSVDSLRLAEEIHSAAARLSHPVEVLVQVNVAEERQKHGVASAAARHLIDQMDTMFNIRVRGMMVMAPAADDPESARAVFARAKELFDEIRRTGSDRFDILSMGMSNDYEVAIREGSNVVRIGSAIFGEGDAPEA